MKLNTKPRPIFQTAACINCTFYSLDEKQKIANRMLHQPNKFYCNRKKQLVIYDKTHPIRHCI